MVITLFRTSLRANVDMEAYERLGLRMYELASKMPGFVSFTEAPLGDRESLAVVAFESDAALAAWRQHPEHLEAQRLGREQFYERYAVQVCTVTRSYDWARTS
jgi:heme-degrading monooxygenase HmoA